MQVTIRVFQAIGVAPPNADVDIVTRLQAWMRGGLADWAGGPSLVDVLGASGLQLESAGAPAIVQLVSSDSGAGPVPGTGTLEAGTVAAPGAGSEQQVRSSSSSSTLVIGVAVGAALVSAIAVVAAVTVIVLARQRARAARLASATDPGVLPKKVCVAVMLP